MNVEKYLQQIVKNVKEGKRGYMNRIRYSKNNGRLESVKTFNHPTNGARYRAVIDETSGTWFVLDAEGGTVAATGQSTSLHKLKKATKTSLEGLGIVFTKEERSKVSDECPINKQADADYRDDCAHGNEDCA